MIVCEFFNTFICPRKFACIFPIKGTVSLEKTFAMIAADRWITSAVWKPLCSDGHTRAGEAPGPGVAIRAQGLSICGCNFHLSAAIPAKVFSRETVPTYPYQLVLYYSYYMNISQIFAEHMITSYVAVSESQISSILIIYTFMGAFDVDAIPLMSHVALSPWPSLQNVAGSSTRFSGQTKSCPESECWDQPQCQKSGLLLRFWELRNFVLWTFPLSKMTVFSLLLHIFTTNVSKNTHRTQKSPTGDAQYVIERCFVLPKLSKVHFISVFSKFHNFVLPVKRNLFFELRSQNHLSHSSSIPIPAPNR